MPCLGFEQPQPLKACAWSLNGLEAPLDPCRRALRLLSIPSPEADVVIAEAAAREPSTTSGQDTFFLPSHHTKHILPTTSRLLVRCPTRAPALSLSRLGKDLEISVGRLRVSHGRPRPTPLLAASTQSAAIDHGSHDGLGAAGAVRRSSCVASRRSAKGSGALAHRDRRTVTAETQWTVPAYYRYVRPGFGRWWWWDASVRVRAPVSIWLRASACDVATPTTLGYEDVTLQLSFTRKASKSKRACG